jgi:hypothetical protein
MNKPIFLLFFTFLFIFELVQAQDTENTEAKPNLGLVFSSFGENDIVRFHPLDGSAAIYGEYFYSLGVSYSIPINSWMEWGTGIFYARHKILIESAPNPNLDNHSYHEYLSLVDLPLNIRLHFLEYFFIKGGAFLNIDLSNSNPVKDQNGIGVNLGIGIRYEFNNGIDLFVNPYLKMYTLYPFSREDNPQRALENGFSFGVLYNLDYL